MPNSIITYVLGTSSSPTEPILYGDDFVRNVRVCEPGVLRLMVANVVVGVNRNMDLQRTSGCLAHIYYSTAMRLINGHLGLELGRGRAKRPNGLHETHLDAIIPLSRCVELLHSPVRRAETCADYPRYPANVDPAGHIASRCDFVGTKTTGSGVRTSNRRNGRQLAGDLALMLPLQSTIRLRSAQPIRQSLSGIASMTV